MSSNSTSRIPVTRKKKRLYTVIAGLTMLGVAAALVLTAFEDNIVFFYSPTDITEKALRPGQTVRLGGLVQAESVKKVRRCHNRIRNYGYEQDHIGALCWPSARPIPRGTGGCHSRFTRPGRHLRRLGSTRQA